MDNVYRITLKQQLLLLTPALIKYGLFGGIYLFFFGFSLPTPIYLYAFLVLFVIDLLPAIILHVQYLVKNWTVILTIDTKSKTVFYQSKETSFTQNFDDIFLAEYVMSYGFKGSAGFYSFAEYRYQKIYFKDGTSIIITCLMINDIKNTLEMLLRLKAKEKFKIIAFVPSS